ncbi:LysR family transcriptional regulator [Salmonella enterica subsp. enterica serovar Daytona]|uniref:LysR family transcriptional regulator n=1 Tax=Salmonella enterica subsp. enterica serovar Daytona TaxID=1962639 RepID=A0A447JBG6_SALET|nr:LysR family transcriptional regulator [Salmonella enterica subsp. enterica]VDY37614.1 LysR family transcriptional regulator [Salmonella enterica subsp. enterica serovar Daytona]
MERLKRMSVFAKVVEFGSFTAAARQLQMSVSSISQTVAKLEDELQVKLLNRSTRSIGAHRSWKNLLSGLSSYAA